MAGTENRGEHKVRPYGVSAQDADPAQNANHIQRMMTGESL